MYEVWPLQASDIIGDSKTPASLFKMLHLQFCYIVLLAAFPLFIFLKAICC